jgi:putative membrane protein
VTDSPPPVKKSDTATNLARERNREAAERTLMAWIRTSMSMIGFGIGFGAAGAYLNGEESKPTRVHDLEFVGSAFILLAIVSLTAAVIQNRRVLNRIRQSQFEYVEPVPIGFLTAALMLLFGFLGLLWVNFR